VYRHFGQFLLAVHRINIYGPITTSAAFPYVVILLSASTLLNWGEAYLHTKWHLDPSSHLTIADMGQKLGAPPPFGRGELDPHLILCGWGQSLPACQVSSWPVQPFGHNTPTSQTDRTGNGPIA